MSPLFINRYSNKFVSRWLILLIDVGIVFFSFLLAYILRYNFRVSVINFDYIKTNFLMLFYIRLACFFYFRSYTGIVRHSSIEDANLLFKVASISTLVAVVISSILRFKNLNETEFYIPISILIIDYFICMFLLIASRFMVKSIYEKLMSDIKTTKNVLIYGAGYSGLITKNVLLKDKLKSYQILGFIDDNPSLVNKTIEGIRVFSRQDSIQKFIRPDSNEVEVIMAIKKISADEKRKISDIFLEKGIVVKALPPVNKWVDGEFSVNQISNVKIEDLLERDVITTNNQKVRNEIDNKVVMITGAAGSIGSEIVRQLLKYLPAKIVLVDQAESALFDLEFEIKNNIPQNTQVHVVVANVSDRIRMRKVFAAERPNLVFHAAAYKHVPMMENNPYEAVKVNIVGTRIIADLSIEFGANKFVMVSTDKAVNPTNVMGATKRMAEMYTQSLNNSESQFSTKFIATRFGNVLGSNGSVIPIFKKQIEAGGPITVTHPDITRYFMTIPEACQLVLEAGTMGIGGEVFIFDMGESVKIADLAKKMITLSGLRVGKDIQIEYSGLRPGEKLYEELLNDNENTLPTHHPKIMKAKVVTPTQVEMDIAIDELERLLYEGNTKGLVKQIKNVVPEFLSKNSIYEELDNTKIKKQTY
ncbi:MAG: polysaccharide biosynthesis protein [Pseudarcicella sp.]|nr:polysaccharide biosynthesis protein [Pseudarcicella sp.]MBP6411191.1 polysaccharide biosynthesis protein [Pseudarcicella sp.]